MRIEADQDACCGSGMRALQVPGVFDQRDEDGIVVVLAAEPASADYGECGLPCGTRRGSGVPDLRDHFG